MDQSKCSCHPHPGAVDPSNLSMLANPTLLVLAKCKYLPAAKEHNRKMFRDKVVMLFAHPFLKSFHGLQWY
jgi:hypothetical protein